MPQNNDSCHFLTIRANNTDKTSVKKYNDSKYECQKASNTSEEESQIKGKEHRQFAFYYLGDDVNGNKRYYIRKCMWNRGKG